MLELWILDCDPYLNCLALVVFSSDLLNVVKQGNCLLWLFASFKLLVFLNDGISVLQSLKVVLNLILWERELAKHVENGFDMIIFKVKLCKTKVFKGSVSAQDIEERGDCWPSQAPI